MRRAPTGNRLNKLNGYVRNGAVIALGTIGNGFKDTESVF
jgi:hypothetical protein